MSESRQRPARLTPHQLLKEIRVHALEALQAGEYPLTRALAQAAEGLSDWIASEALEQRLKAAGRRRGALSAWFDPDRLRDTPLVASPLTGDEQPEPSESMRETLRGEYSPERIAAERAQGLYTVHDGPCICRDDPDACWHVHPADRKPRRDGVVYERQVTSCSWCPGGMIDPLFHPGGRVEHRAPDPMLGGEVDMRPRPAAGSPELQDAPTERVGFACPECPGFVPDSLYHLAQHAEQVHGVPASRPGEDGDR